MSALTWTIIICAVAGVLFAVDWWERNRGWPDGMA